MDSLVFFFVTIELSPFFKVTGMGDLLRAVVRELARRKFRVVVLAPDFGCEYKGLKIRGSFTTASQFRNRLKVKDIRVAEDDDGVSYYFVAAGEAQQYLEQRVSEGRGNETGRMWLDFCHNVSMIVDGIVRTHFDLTYDRIVTHCFHWQTAPLLFLLDQVEWRDKAKLVLTVDVLEEQGRFGSEVLDVHEIFRGMSRTGESMVNFLVSGLRCADVVHTVSPTYAKEIQTPPKGGGLEKIFQDFYARGRLIGVLNGIDYQLTDWQCIPILHDTGLCLVPTEPEVLQHKQRAKAIFQTSACLPQDPSAFLISMGHRFCEQKNFELIARAMDDLMALSPRPQIYLRAWPEPQGESSDRELWYALARLSKRYRYNLAFLSPYDRDASLMNEAIFIDRFLYYAASDLFLMPSVWEPCGLCQLEAMRFGALPLVSGVGGLLDTVKSIDDYDDGWGFVLKDISDPTGLVRLVGRAIQIWQEQRDQWDQMVRRALSFDSSITTAVDNYLEKIYLK